jgi:hypothetical protein
MSSITFNNCRASKNKGINGGDLNMKCNSIMDVSNITFCNSTNYLETINDLSYNINELLSNKYDKTGGVISGNVEISGNLDMSCNLINDVSNIFFCNSTNYLDTIAQLDISINKLLVIIDDLSAVDLTEVLQAIDDLSNNKYEKTGGLISGDVEISGNLNMSCNLINDVSNIFFCNSTNYLDTINDLSSNINDLSNNKYEKTGGLISGDVEISGNLNISGYLSVIDISNSENLLYLNNVNLLTENSILINTVIFDVDSTKEDDFDYLMTQLDKPSRLLPDDLTGNNKWGGAILSEYQNIFMFPADASNVIEFNTGNYDVEIKRFPILDKPLLNDKWKGASLAKNSVAIGVPYNHDKILRLQIETDDFTTDISLIDIPNSYINEIDGSYNNAWISATITPNTNLFYMAPGRAKRVLTFDYTTDDVSSIELPADIRDLSGIKYSTTILAPNKKIYMFPRDVSNILMIDTMTNDLSYINVNIPPNQDSTTTDLFYGGVLATNKKMYIIPYKNKHIMEFDSSDNNINFIELPDSPLVDFNSSKANWNNASLFKNGKVYGIPNEADVILEFDPFTYKTRYLPLPSTINKPNKYIGGIITDTEIIYGIPKDEDNILEINFGEDTIYKNWMVNSYFNKV